MRRNLVAGAISMAMVFWGGPAFPCGGAFGHGLRLAPTQKIVVSYKGGNETYFFSPHFCGQSAHFGLILPMPNQLASMPVLGDVNAVPELEDLTAPTVIEQKHCFSELDLLDAGVWPDGGSGDAGSPGSAEVIDKGQVGIFDWTLIKADTAQAFTDWLDLNQYPYDPSVSTVFDYYVSQGWYFVAFKITADSQDPPAGRDLCGDFGPIQLSFAASSLVVPARIAAASSHDTGIPDAGALFFDWRVFAIADRETALTTSLNTDKRFSGALSANDLVRHPAVSQIAAAGNRLTELEVKFDPSQLDSDLLFGAAASNLDFRRTEYSVTYVACDAGAIPDGGEDTGASADSGAGSPDAGDQADGNAGDAGANLKGGGGGCGCSTTPSEPAPLWAFCLGAAPLALVMRIRGRRRRRASVRPR